MALDSNGEIEQPRLTRGQYTVDRARWMHATDYTHCQSFADVARLAKVEVIRYASVRDPRQGINLALLTCTVFTQQKPIDRQTWRIHLSDAGVHAIRESPRLGITFDRKTFADDPRIAKLRWIRA